MNVVINCPQPTFAIILHVLVIYIILVPARQKKQTDLYVEQKNTTQYGIRSIRDTGARRNALPLELRQSISLSNFKTKL